MSRFSRAFDGALKVANLTQSDAAKLAGYHSSLVSRVLSGESALTTEHVEKLLLAVQDKADREHCLCEFLVDCCPEDYRGRLILSFGTTREPRAAGNDKLTRDLLLLDQLATENPDLRRLLSLLVAILKTP